MEIIRELKPKEPKPFELFLLADPDLDVIHSYLDHSKCMVLEQNNEIIGTYLLLPTRPHTVELVNIAIKESKQGKGYGKKLVKHAVDKARELGYKIIEVGTGNSSIQQIGLYQKCGFEITGIDKGFFTRHYKDPIYENGIRCKDMVRMKQELYHCFSDSKEANL